MDLVATSWLPSQGQYLLAWAAPAYRRRLCKSREKAQLSIFSIKRQERGRRGNEEGRKEILSRKCDLLTVFVLHADGHLSSFP